jgi:hypothetical protein
MNGEQANRFYEVKFGEDTEVAILPGENPLEFECLLTKLAEEWAPDGILEEYVVLTIARCMWRSKGYQQFILSKVTGANTGALVAFYELLAPATHEHKIKRELDRVKDPLADRLRREFPRKKFKDTKAWAEAMSNEIEKVFLPGDMRPSSRPEEALRFPEPISDELFDRELVFEERNQAALQRAINRLLEFKKAKRQVRFPAIQRFERTHPERLNVKIVR